MNIKDIIDLLDDMTRISDYLISQVKVMKLFHHIRNLLPPIDIRGAVAEFFG
jgi:hypothetical protein